MADNCCVKNTNERGLIKGFLYGLLPHSFCIGFVVFSIVGSVSAVAVFKKLMLIPYFFQFLVALSILMATFSAILYLKRNNCLCKQGIKSKWKYLTILYGITIFTNLFMFYGVFPALASFNSSEIDVSQLASLSLAVQIPCSGNAPLIIDELKKNGGIKNINFKMPDIFEIKYNPGQTSPEKIAEIEIFETFKATIKN